MPRTDPRETAHGEPHATSRRASGWILRIVVAALATILLAEGLLQIGALLVSDRSESGATHGEINILGVGDSHMFGVLVEEDESFPGSLQAALDEEEPGRYRVINLGVPGMNTSQVHNRLAENIRAYAPGLIFVWCGVNNDWNRTEASWTSHWWTVLLENLRLYRFYRVWRSSQELDADIAELASDRSAALRDIGEHERISLQGGRPEVIRRDPSPKKREESEMEELALRDYLGMAEIAQNAGIPIVFVGYPVNAGTFAAANRAMIEAASETPARYFRTTGRASHLPGEKRRLLSGAHPTGPMYTAFGTQAARVVRRLLREAPATPPENDSGVAGSPATSAP